MTMTNNKGPTTRKRQQQFFDRDKLLDKEFLNFASFALLPGGCCHRSSIVEKFKAGFHYTYRKYQHNPNFQIFDLDIELLLFRWNEKYAHADVDSNGTYKGFHIRGEKNANQPQQQQIRQNQTLTMQQQQQNLKNSTLERKLNPQQVKNQASARLLRMALAGKVPKGISETELQALNFQLEQVALESSLETSASPTSGKEEQNKTEDRKRKNQIGTDRTSSRSCKNLGDDSIDDNDESDDDDEAKKMLKKKYPPCVDELILNGFQRSKVISAYELIGDNFDELLTYLASTTIT